MHGASQPAGCCTKPGQEACRDIRTDMNEKANFTLAQPCKQISYLNTRSSNSTSPGLDKYRRQQIQRNSLDAGASNCAERQKRRDGGGYSQRYRRQCQRGPDFARDGEAAELGVNLPRPPASCEVTRVCAAVMPPCQRGSQRCGRCRRRRCVRRGWEEKIDRV